MKSYHSYSSEGISGQHRTEPRPPSISSPSKLKKAALGYAERRRPVFPCKSDKSPHWVEGVLEHGCLDATTDPRRINMLWGKFRTANIGMATGEASDLIVVDVDPKHGGIASLEELERKHGKLPTTLTVRTPSGGFHLYFRYVEGITNSPGGLPEGIDVRGEGGYVLVPPSVGYSWEDRSPVADAPDWLLELIRERKPTEAGGKRRSCGSIPDGEPIPEGQRNTTLFFLALDLKDSGKSRPELTADLLAVNEARCLPPLPEAEVEKIGKSVIRYQIRRGKVAPEVVEAVNAMKRAWWATAWRGVGGKTERDVLRVLIEWAKRYGHLAAGGVRFTLSWRTLALAAACSFRTVSRVVPRLKAKGWLLDDNATRSGTEAGAFVLQPRPTDITRNTSSAPNKKLTASDVTLARLPEETPCFRWRGFVGKGKAGALYALEVFGEQGRDELADRLGFSRPRDLERKYLAPLMELGLVEDRGGVYALHDDHRERVEKVRGLAYGGGERKVRRKDASGRMVTFVREVPATSEAERDEMDRRVYDEQRRRFAERLAYDSPEADEACIALLNELDRELDRVAAADGLICELEHADMIMRLSRSQSGWRHADSHLESLGFAPEWFDEPPANPEGGGSGLLDPSLEAGHSAGGPNQKEPRISRRRLPSGHMAGKELSR